MRWIASIALDAGVFGCSSRALLEAIQRLGQLADERPHDALAERLLQLDLFEAAGLLVEGGQTFGDDVRAGAGQIQAEHQRARRRAPARRAISMSGFLLDLDRHELADDEHADDDADHAPRPAAPATDQA